MGAHRGVDGQIEGMLDRVLAGKVERPGVALGKDEG
jgi:hypothetical protein